jgi:C4-dicarboxylate transporter DctM subunit
MKTSLFAVFFGFVLLSIPLSFSMGLASELYLVFNGTIPLSVIPQRMFVGIDNFTLLSIPLYILAGELMETGGISKRLIHFAACLVGHIKGGFGLITVVATMFFSGVSGSESADTAAIGGVMIPAMSKKGYSPAQATAIVTASGGMGILIPPCLTMIVLAAVANLSVGALFLAGFLPALVMGGGLMLYIYKQGCDGLIPSQPRVPVKEIFRAFYDASLALLTPVIILGGIIGGICTATEAAAIAVFYSLIVSMLIYKEIKIQDLPHILSKTAVTSASILFLVGVASLFGWIIARERIPMIIAEWLLEISSGPWVFLLVVNVIFCFVGSVLEGSPAVIILAPLLFPIANKLGIDPIHFGTVLIANLGVAFILPPTGLCLIVACSVGKVRMVEVVRPLMPYLVVMIITLLIIVYVPWFSTVIPEMTGLHTVIPK